MKNIMQSIAQIEIDSSQIDNLPMSDNPQTGVTTITGWLFVFIAGTATVVMIIAGINYITSRGDPQKTANARNTIIYAAIGIAVAALATSLIRFVAENLS